MPAIHDDNTIRVIIPAKNMTPARPYYYTAAGSALGVHQFRIYALYYMDHI